MSDEVSREALVAEADRLLPLLENIAVQAHRVNLAGTWGDDALRDISKLIAGFLSLLHADAAKVQELTDEVKRLKALMQDSDAEYARKIESRLRAELDTVRGGREIWKANAEKAEADVTRLTKQWEALMKCLRSCECECGEGLGCTACYLRQMSSELEAQ